MGIIRALITLLSLPITAAAAPSTPSIEPIKAGQLAEFTKAFAKAERPQEAYGKVLKSLLATHPDLEIHFVAGKADGRFVSVDPSLWSERLTYEEFSTRDGLGRMLCPEHPRNAGPAKGGKKKYVMVIRADDPGDTFVHEYLHYLQARRDPSVCALYNRLEASPGVAPSNPDIARNLALEYEVVRFVFENRSALRIPDIAVAAMLEKIVKLVSEIPDLAAETNRAYGWKSRSAQDFYSAMNVLFERERKRIAAMPAYALPARLGAVKTGEPVKTVVTRGIALLKRPPAGLPICLAWETDSPRGQPPAQLAEAIQAWNEAGKKTGREALFSMECERPSVRVVFSRNAGETGDGVLRLGEIFELAKASAGADAPATLLLVRGAELRSYVYLIETLLRQKLTAEIRAASVDPSDLRAKFAVYVEGKKGELLKHLFLHELGHLLGLGHNFNEADRSVMAYSSSHGDLSAYDLEALRLALDARFEPSRDWRARIEAPDSVSASMD